MPEFTVFFVLGTNGEGYILDEDEKTEVIRVAVNTVKGRVPVYAGTGCVSTRDTVRMSRKAKELGGGCALHHYAKLCCSLPRRTHPAL